MPACAARTASRDTSALVCDLVVLRFRDHAGLRELGVAVRLRIGILRLRGVAGQGRFSLPQLRAVAGYGRFGLAERFLKRTRVDLESRSPLATFCPSVKWTRSSCPATCDLTCTIAEASTVPTTRSSKGTDSSVAFATDTGTGRRTGCALNYFLLLAAGEQQDGSQRN